MDRTPLNQETNLQVTLEEIVAELNKQIASLNFELTVSKLVVQKLQNALQNATENAQEPARESSKINTESF